MDIDHRILIRAECGLPALDVEAELARLAAVQRDAEFERYWERRRPEFEHVWTGNRDGWITNMGRYSLTRRRVRTEFDSGISN